MTLSGKTSHRYSFLKVAACTFLASLGLVVYIYVYRLAIDVSFNWVAYREYLLNQVIGTFATSIFYYYSLNEFHKLFVEKRNFYSFIIPVLLGLLSVEVYNLVVDR